MRIFLSIEIKKQLIENIQKIQKKLQNNTTSNIKYVNQNNFHLTLKFFGEINKRKEKQIHKIIINTLKNYSEYNIKLKKVNAFPNIKNPRVIWVGIDDTNNTTINLIQQLDEKFNKIGFKKERDYTPHLTIGRVKDLNDKNNVYNQLKKLNNCYVGEMKVKNIELKSSQLTKTGPIYSTEKKYELKENKS